MFATAAPAPASATSPPRTCRGTDSRARRRSRCRRSACSGWCQKGNEMTVVGGNGQAVWPGRPFPLGPVWDGRGTNFSLFSENAERVELCLFDDADRETRVELTERTVYQWHGYFPGIGP